MEGSAVGEVALVRLDQGELPGNGEYGTLIVRELRSGQIMNGAAAGIGKPRDDDVAACIEGGSIGQNGKCVCLNVLSRDMGRSFVVGCADLNKMSGDFFSYFEFFRIIDVEKRLPIIGHGEILDAGECSAADLEFGRSGAAGLDCDAVAGAVEVSANVFRTGIGDVGGQGGVGGGAADSGQREAAGENEGVQSSELSSNGTIVL